MKIATIVGARPQFIKASLISKELRKEHEEVLVHTGQHYDIELSKVFFDELGIPEPDYNLDVGSDTHTRQTGKIMMSLEEVLVAQKFDLVLVYGDTNSTIAAALTAVKLHLPIAHVEAGPRMFDKSIPEEVNRILTDRISDLLFAPTQTAVDNLRREGIEEGVYLTGDVMLDSFLYFSPVAEQNSRILDKLGLSPGQYLLATIHRVRNTDVQGNLENIVDALLSLDGKVVFPLHPRTAKYLKQYGLYQRLKDAPNILLIKPVGYLDSIVLTSHAKKVLTDSGGLQKEAYFSKVPCITLDEVSGWPETISDEWNILVGSDKDRIIEEVRNFEPEGKQRNIFGNGKAAQKMAGIISRFNTRLSD